ncbi:MAG: pantetheine-phosphate adenylyltransferase [Nitrospiraceae bacterium]|nr:pantetheine-phosphate adenylyltransferase [Nitrospiraceae bacterium]MSR24944.1 pantetheine-phosphate adenylyltransferase [Nitrospiraceae bacterium]
MKIGVYPGTFDPVTYGHTDIIARSLHVFDKVIVAVAPNPTKRPLFDLAERVEMVNLVTKGLPHVEVVTFKGLLVEYAQKRKAHAVIRGLRAISDFEYEFQMALVNRKLNKSVETVFLMPSEEYSYLTSTIIKEVARFGGRLTDFLHPQVAQRLLRRLGRRAT